MNKLVVFLNHLDLNILDKDFYQLFFNNIVNLKKEDDIAVGRQ